MKNDFPFHISKFLVDYLQTQRGASTNTSKTYRDAFVQLLEYLYETKGLRSDKVGLKDLTPEVITGFLDWIESEKKVTVATRNNRLGAVKSFFRYLSYREPEFLSTCTVILGIRQKKFEPKPMNYLTLDAYKLLLASFNVDDKKQMRDLCIVAVMYESGGRVSEIAGIRSVDFKSENPYTLLLHGKGKKTRIVPIDKSVGKLVDRYRQIYKVKEDEPLFFNTRREPLTREGLNYVLQKYFCMARKNRPEIFPPTISPHCIRHSRAMHLLENNVNLIYIRDLLGHSSVMTTEIYSKANPEIKRIRIEEATKTLLGDNIGYTEEEKNELLNWLKNNI